MLTETTLMPFVLLRPWCLLGIVAALLIFAIRYQTDKKAKRQGLIAAHLSEHLVSMPSQSKSQRFTFPILIAIASIALAGPSWRSVDMPVYQVEKAQVLVLDESYSMYATDLKPNRLSQQKYKATDLIKQWDEGEKALITYAGDAFTIAPLTTDGHSILNQIPHISPEIMPVTGSHADLALEKGISLLENSGYAKGQIVFFTDGIDQATSEKMINRLKGTPWTVSILGFGTEQGSAITMPDGSLLKNSQNEIVVPTLDQTPLRAIAQAGNGIYLTVTTDNSDIQKLGNYFNVHNLHKKKAGQKSKNQFAIDDGYWVAFLLLPCFLLLFRKGLFYILILSVSLPLSIPRVEASAWQNKQQEAFQAYQGQDYQKAAELYANPMEKGSALYKKKDYKGAIEQFKKLNFKTPQNAPAFYNQGNAFAQLKEFDKAIKAYDDALKIDPDFKDAAGK